MDIDNSENILKKLLNHDTNLGIIYELDNIPDNVDRKDNIRQTYFSRK